MYFKRSDLKDEARKNGFCGPEIQARETEKLRVAQEMAMPLPSDLAAQFYDAVFVDPDYFPSPSVVYAAYKNLPRQTPELAKFIIRVYPRLYRQTIAPLQQELWPLRNSPDRLADYISQHPIYYGTEKRWPGNSSDPIRQSLQNLKNWVYYWTSDLYALMRPELLRQVNELKSILDRPVKAQRNKTPRSEIATAGPAIRTPEVSILAVDVDGETAWKAQTVVYTRGGLQKHVFADFFDTKQLASGSPLVTEASKLTPEQYLHAFVDYELVAD